jgi:hypothetical protein
MSEEAVVTYSFPVEVVVVGGLSADDHALIQARIWEDFGEALDRSAV